MRGVQFADCTMMTRDDVMIFVGAASEILFNGCYQEGKGVIVNGAWMASGLGSRMVSTADASRILFTQNSSFGTDFAPELPRDSSLANSRYTAATGAWNCKTSINDDVERVLYHNSSGVRLRNSRQSWVIADSLNTSVFNVNHSGHVSFGTNLMSKSDTLSLQHQNVVSKKQETALRIYSTGNIAIGVEGVSTEHRVNGNIGPSLNSTYSLGFAPNFWSEVYAKTGTINTSDRRQKQDIGSIPDAVIAAWRDVDLLQYRWREAVTEKGVGARYHVGLIAQSIKETFGKHGLDAQDYGLLILDQWDDQYEDVYETVTVIDDETGEEHQIEQATGEKKLAREAGDVWGIRAEECLFLEAESNRRLIKDMTARLAAVEEQIITK